MKFSFQNNISRLIFCHVSNVCSKNKDQMFRKYPVCDYLHSQHLDTNTN